MFSHGKKFFVTLNQGIRIKGDLLSLFSMFIFTQCIYFNVFTGVDMLNFPKTQYYTCAFTFWQSSCLKASPPDEPSMV